MKKIITSQLIIFCLMLCPVLNWAQNREADSLSLVALYDSTNGENWYNPWDLNDSISIWYGVTLDDGRVSELYLEYNNLEGNIPSALGGLSDLTKLNLSNNRLSGSIPSTLGNLSNLQDLSLHWNQLSGSIPTQLRNLDSLVHLFLESNELTGSIPPELGDLNSLGALYLHTNKLSGRIPPELGNLNNLIGLQLHNNKLTDSIPPELGNLSNLEYLYLHGNKLIGNIPQELGNLNSLLYMNLSYNELSGNIPFQFVDLDDLIYLELDDNELSGEIPDFINSPNMGLFTLTYNKFSFDEIENYLSNNSLPGDFRYSPQYHGEVQSHIVEEGEPLGLSLSSALSGNNNENINYQWKQNDIELAGSTDSIFTISNLQISDVGKYTLHMTDPTRVADLELISEPIYVIVPGYDLYGQPVVYSQIMMQFDNETDRKFYEEEYLAGNGWVQDSCSCNRGLYLWQFESDTTALQILLDINTKTENQESEADVDGGPNNIFDIGVSNNSGTAWSWAGDYTGVTYQDSVRIYMLDSGLDEGNWNASPYLLPDAPKDSCYNIAASGYDYTDSLVTFTTTYVDSLGHGTFGFRAVVEGLGDYMNIKSVPLKVFDQSGQGTLFKFICALYHAIDHDADLINISAGYRGQPSEILAEAVQLAQQKGIFIVTAAGNDGQNIDSIPQFPAYFSGTTYEREINGNINDIPYDNVISVASINAQDSLSVFSNYGNNNTTLAAYGENMSGYAA